MGPIIIFDKSTLESLNPDEAMWLDHFFLSNITPLFFIETLADLEKKVRSGRSVEDIVGNLAYKTPDFSSKVNVYHRTLLEGELSGIGRLDLRNGRPHIDGGKRLELGGKTGVIFQPSPEEEAFSRWQNHEFLNLERLFAKAWRQDLSNINLEESYKTFQSFFPISKPKNLTEVKKIVDFHINESNQGEVLQYGLSLLGASPQFRAEILFRWQKLGKPLIKDFAPYFLHVFSIDLFFYIAIAADLIGRGRPSHKIDIAYLYYLPFCMIFTSNDNLHAEIAPFFMRENQTFFRGADLKLDLAKIDQHFSALPEEVKSGGVTSFAIYPPDDSSFLMARLWDKHMPKWRHNKMTHEPMPDRDSEITKKIMEEIKDFKEKAVPVSGNSCSTKEADHMLIERKVRMYKGKWMRFPPEVMEQSKDEKSA
ncbi:MAG: hypothetical protein A3C58_02675 [Candidatus Staskawiczbacteria bacterium RIFCSPHIGHO2_02_FULL_34_10]|uniref:Uncharacterized protein n=1 Tax=Candidatus Staskawiczbacteria bacterium RIFCSPHIGHO2_02_FULL_34_10 TaxID=1802205 RepID=A0A1G2HVU8_9BACT|nr:MAG: hypothetical protein A3C58_02675 [Candidatus Staskawiczbacteria bacterium RIFCSPHIGHO2_02_FULL_34_10]